MEMSRSLAEALRVHTITRKQDKLKYGWTELPPWMFVTQAATPIDPANVRKAMQRVLKVAKLPLHFTPHCLRHTYASILLAEGVSPVFVQEQLGHATIELTVSTYGRWLKKKAPGALDKLDSVTIPESGSKVVAEREVAVGAARSSSAGIPYIQSLKVELARGIEPPTCGLQKRPTLLPLYI